ncbi:MAG: hypothetical protein LUG61_12070 [Lachnospiraceae bacterium]|nr:hypothetical protein [Lachnospiraceae bacterium]
MNFQAGQEGFLLPGPAPGELMFLMYFHISALLSFENTADAVRMKIPALSGKALP